MYSERALETSVGEGRPSGEASSSGSVESDNLVIRVRNLSKCYPIYERPRDRLKQFILPRLRHIAGLEPRNYHREFWALRDISFDVKKGETVGIVGRNGAGKSTLLQLICGTLTPSAGSVEVNGRVAALLELGAGFNPEFTGTENIFLNGALLGMSREQIESRIDEIAAFADIGQFLDQPVKTYSSGMYVRLAFAVQACVEPEILVVDEALSVGDIGFQYKCFKRMEELRNRGVTILMVTHSTGSILQYASRCIVLDSGRVSHDTEKVLDAVLAYEKGMLPQKHTLPIPAYTTADSVIHSSQQLVSRQAEGRNAAVEETRFGSARAIIDSLHISRADDESADVCTLAQAGEEIVLRFRILSSDHISNVVLGVSLSRVMGEDVWGDNNLNAGEPFDLVPGKVDVEFRARLPLSAGEYLVHCGLACFVNDTREELDQRRPAAKLRFWSPRNQVGVVHAPALVRVIREGTP